MKRFASYATILMLAVAGCAIAYASKSPGRPDGRSLVPKSQCGYLGRSTTEIAASNGDFDVIDMNDPTVDTQ